MPAKSQFDVVELDGNTLIVGGDIGLEAGARSVPPSHLHVVVMQNGRVFRQDGPSGTDTKKWRFEMPASGIQPDAEAQVFGLTVQFDDVRDGAAFETFAWTQTVTVERKTAQPSTPPQS